MSKFTPPVVLRTTALKRSTRCVNSLLPHGRVKCFLSIDQCWPSQKRDTDNLEQYFFPISGVMIFVKITKGWICFARSFLPFQWWLSQPQRTPGYRRTSSRSWRSSNLKCKLLEGVVLSLSFCWVLTLQVSRLYPGQLIRMFEVGRLFFFFNPQVIPGTVKFGERIWGLC